MIDRNLRLFLGITVLFLGVTGTFTPVQAQTEHTAPPDIFTFPTGKTLYCKMPVTEIPNGEWDKMLAESAGYEYKVLVENPETKFKKGFMAFVVDADPVTIWNIVTDIEHFHATDPEFPKNKGRRTMMPYVHWGQVCEENGDKKLFQLLFLPLLEVRKYQLDEHQDRHGFPWESAWSPDQNLTCVSTLPEEFKKDFDDAIQIKHNYGGWHLQPLPAKYLKTKKDFQRTYINYLVDSHPGGSVGKIAWLVNKATGTALPNVAKNVRFHSGRIDKNLLNFWGQEKVDSFHAQQEAYLKAMEAAYPQVP